MIAQSPIKKYKKTIKKPYGLPSPPLCLENSEFKRPIDQFSAIFKRRGIEAFVFGGAIYKKNPGDIDIFLPWSSYDAHGNYTGEIENLIFNIKKILDLRKRKSFLADYELRKLTGLELWFKTSTSPFVSVFAEILEQENIRFVQAYTKGERSVIKVCVENVDVDFVIADKNIEQHAENVDFRIGRIYHSLYDNQNYYPNEDAKEKSLHDYYHQELHMTRTPAQMFAEDSSRILRLIRALSSSECTLSVPLEKTINKYLSSINYRIALDPSRLYHDMTLFFFSGHALKNLDLLVNKWPLFEHLFGCNYPRSQHVINLTRNLIHSVLELSDQCKAEKALMHAPSLFYYALHWDLIKKGCSLHQLKLATNSSVNFPFITPEEDRKNREILFEFEAQYLGSLPAEKSPKSVVAYPINEMEVLDVKAALLFNDCEMPFPLQAVKADLIELDRIEALRQEQEKRDAEAAEKLIDEIKKAKIDQEAAEAELEQQKELEKQRQEAEKASKKTHEEAAAARLREKEVKERKKAQEKVEKDKEKAAKIATKAAEKEAKLAKDAEDTRLRNEQEKVRKQAEKAEQEYYGEAIKWPNVYKAYKDKEERPEETFETLSSFVFAYYTEVKSTLKSHALNSSVSINDVYFEWIKSLFDEAKFIIDLHNDSQFVLEKKISQYKMLKISYPLMKLNIQERLAIIDEIILTKCVDNKNKINKRTIAEFYRENKRRLEAEIKKSEPLEPELTAFDADTWQMLADYFSSYLVSPDSAHQMRPENAEYAKYAEQCSEKSRKKRREEEKKEVAAQREAKKQNAILAYTAEIEQSSVLYEQWKGYPVYDFFSAITGHFQGILNRFELSLREYFSLSIAYTRFIHIICAEVEDGLLAFERQEQAYEAGETIETPVEKYKRKMDFVFQIEKRQEYIEQVWHEYTKYKDAIEVKAPKSSVISPDALETYERIKKLSKKIKILKESSPDFSGKIWYELGEYFVRMKQIKCAVHCYQKSINKTLETKAVLEPFFYWAYYRMAEIKLEDLKNDESLVISEKCFEEVIDLYCKSLVCVSQMTKAKEIRCLAHVRLAEIEYIKGNYLRAAEYYIEILGMPMKKLLSNSEKIEPGMIYLHAKKKNAEDSELIFCCRFINNAGIIVDKGVSYSAPENFDELLSLASIHRTMTILHSLGELQYHGYSPNPLIPLNELYWQCGLAYEAAGHWQKAIYNYCQAFSQTHWDDNKLYHLLKLIEFLTAIKADSVVSPEKYQIRVINAIEETIVYFKGILVDFHIFRMDVVELSKNIDLTSEKVQKILQDYNRMTSEDSLPDTQEILTREYYEANYQLSHGSYQKYSYQYHIKKGDACVASKDIRNAKKHYEKAMQLGLRLSSAYDKFKALPLHIMNEEVEQKKILFMNNPNDRFIALIQQGHYFKTFNDERARNAFFKAFEESTNGSLLEEGHRKNLFDFYSACYVAKPELGLAEHYFHAAELAVNKTQEAQALIFYYKSLEINPDHYLVHVKLAYYYKSLSTPQPEKALEHYHAFMKLSRENYPYEYSVIFGSYDECLREMLMVSKEAESMIAVKIIAESLESQALLAGKSVSPSRLHGSMYKALVASQNPLAIQDAQDAQDAHKTNKFVPS